VSAPFPAEPARFDVAERHRILRGLYLGLLGREPDAAGLAHWSAAWSPGVALDAIAAALLASGEALDVAAAVDTAAEAAAAALRSADRSLVVVDVGAQNLSDEAHVYTGLLRHGLPTRVIGFEPLEHRRRERLLSADDRLTLLSAFIGDGRHHTFHVNAFDATSSLLPLNGPVIRRFTDLDHLRTIRTEPAETATLDDVLSGEPHVDLLKLDIQGFELSALRAAPAVLARTQVVHCEVFFLEMYEGQALFGEVEQHMRGCGFELVDLSPLCRYPLAGTSHGASRDWLGWADAIFFRRSLPDEPWENLLVRSLVALAVYGKRSLAASLAEGLAATPAAPYRAALFR
jgi:FkbM family methyltransferase